MKCEGHAHKNRHGHALRPLSQEEKTDLERRWREEKKLGAEAKKRGLAQDREEENRRRQEAARAYGFWQTQGLDFGRGRSQRSLVFGSPCGAACAPSAA